MKNFIYAIVFVGMLCVTGYADTSKVHVVTPTLTSLSLESNVTTLNVGEKAELTLMGTYSDGSSKEPDVNVEYIITPVNSVDVNGSVLTAKRDADVTVQVKVGNTLSNTLALTITWTVGGHTLPPEPNKEENDKTLLGIDTNDNGVRDDVERWIYQTYDHPIERGIFMQSARAYNKVIVDPSRAHETMKFNRDAFSCESYWTYESKINNEHFFLDQYRDLEKEIEKIQFNTIKRHMAYERYNATLSGGVYSLPPSDKNMCEFDENGILKDLP